MGISDERQRGPAARESERTRIAREMHDTLAHRISLVALHAEALAYRTDLGRAQTAETAALIQANAQLALTELRQVLGVLRGGTVEPQPTLAELPALLTDAREAGTPITYPAGSRPTWYSWTSGCRGWTAWPRSAGSASAARPHGSSS